MHALSRRSFTVALRSATCYRSSSYSAAVISSPLIVSQPCDDKQFAHGDQIQQFVRSYSQIASVPMYKWQVEVDNDMAEAKRDNKSEVLSKECPADVAASAQISNRARFLPSVLATGIFSWSANMERPMMARTVEDASSQQIKRSSIVFLISPDNPIITNLNAALPVDKSARGLVDLQYDVASLGGVAHLLDLIAGSQGGDISIKLHLTSYLR